ncbi:hypothetical protein E4U48_006654 [Claviceps purpurea]|nr:hypothetical protein E4U51_002163 [Claviceps purpurea]KAG6242825.1 hypothetical protein E4U23_006748 [Claviceps purpurea]KAG6263648.1 hypothetical protein E4U48_006654 [Claviceps purpurea]
MKRRRKMLLGREGEPEVRQSTWTEILGSGLSSLVKALQQKAPLISTSLIEVCQLMNAERIATFEAVGVSSNCTASPGSKRLEKSAKERLQKEHSSTGSQSHKADN